MINLLILEDQPAVREIISEIAEELDAPMHIGHAASICQARTMLSDSHWDGMVTDFNLGDGKSLDLIAELRNKNNHLPIILVSGFLSPECMQQAATLHIKHILAKPFEPAALLDCMRAALFVPQQIRHANEPLRPENKLLPKVFEMDRQVSLLYRMFDEMPSKKDVSSLCQATLTLGLEMTHAKRGFLALFERKHEKLVMVSEQLNHPAHISNCHLKDTPFKALIHHQSEYLEILPEASHAPCWPDIYSEHYIAIPVCLQGIPMGVLCLMDCDGSQAIPADERYLLGLLIKKLDTLLDNRAVHAALADSMNETLIALVRSLEARDRYTKDHSSRVSQIATLFAQELQLDEETIQMIRTGGLLHDIGKVGIADEILLKPGRYTEQEFAKMKAHPAIGDAILKNMDTLARERLIVRHHHERMDGKGYPDGLIGDAIPFEARIVCVADSIDAMTSHRVYRMARPLSFCLEQLKSNSGTQFDAQVVDVAVSLIERGLIHTQAQSEPDVEEILMPLSAIDPFQPGVLHA